MLYEPVGVTGDPVRVRALRRSPLQVMEKRYKHRQCRAAGDA